MNDHRAPRFAAFRALDSVYRADNCVPLVAAAESGDVQFGAFARGHYPGSRLPSSAVDGLLSIGQWNATVDQSWGLDWHRNEGIEISYLASGSLGFAVDDREWALEAGQITITRPWQQHRVGSPNVSASHLHWLILDVGVRRPNQLWRWPAWIALSPSDVLRLTQLLQLNEHPVVTGNKEFRQAMLKATRQWERREDRVDSTLRIHVSTVLFELLELLDRQEIELDPSLTGPRRGVRLFLRDLEFALDRPWSIPMMAAACEIGVTQFTSHCRAITNMSPNQYLNHKRVGLAQSLLENSDIPILEVAARAGFESSQYFATKFRALTGVTPNEFRRRAKLERGGGGLLVHQGSDRTWMPPSRGRAGRWRRAKGNEFSARLGGRTLGSFASACMRSASAWRPGP